MRDGTSVSVVFIYGLGAAVTIVWIASVIVSILDHSYETPLVLHGLMGTVVGSVFSTVGLARGRRHLGKDSDE